MEQGSFGVSGKGISGREKNCELEVGSTTYKVLKRDTVTAFYDADGNTLFDVTNDRLKEEYEAMESLDETEPKSEIGRAIAGIEKQAFDEAVYMGEDYPCGYCDRECS